MSDKDNNSKLSEFDFDGDDQIQDVVDSTMVESTSSWFSWTNFLVALSVCGGGYLGYRYIVHEQDVGQVLESAKPKADTLRSLAQEKSVPIPDIKVPSLTKNTANSEQKTIKTPELSQLKRTLTKDGEQASQEIVEDFDPRDMKPSKSLSSPVTDLNKNLAVIDDEKWKDIEKEILAQSESQTQVKDEISSLVDKNQTLSESLNKNLAQTQKIDEQLETLNRSLGSLKSSLDSFDGQFDTLSDKIVSIEKKLTAQAAEFFAQTDLAEEVGSDISNYTLYAVIPGRAWLRRSDNTILSVVEGQEVDNLGKIVTIDARLAAVTLDNGSILRQ